MRKLLLVASLLLVVVLSVPAPASGLLVDEPLPALPKGTPLDAEVPCANDLVAHEISPAQLGAYPAGMYLTVLLDGVSQADAVSMISSAEPAFWEHGVEFSLRYESVTTPGTGPLDVADALDFARDHFGGALPYLTHLVYLATARDLTSPLLGSNALGQAQCVGGVEDPTTAFAVGEANPAPTIGLEALGLGRHAPSMIFAHEIGHLLGAQHHLANCVEGRRYLPELYGPSPCTVMFPASIGQSVWFSYLNGSIIHGHARRAEEF